MWNSLRVVSRLVMLGAALVVSAPAVAQQPPATAEAPADAPTKKDPLRFNAFNVSMETGMAGTTQIAIERWSTDEERQMLLGLVSTSKEGERGQQKLLTALQKIKPRTGFIRTPNSLGWDLKYAWETALPDGTRQIVIVTDKPVSFGAAASGSRVMDYPFTMIQMHMKPNEKGEGKMLAASSILTNKNGKLEIENYGQEPVRLTSITEEQKKKKKSE
jgi:hypothetical protein